MLHRIRSLHSRFTEQIERQPDRQADRQRNCQIHADREAGGQTASKQNFLKSCSLPTKKTCPCVIPHVVKGNRLVSGNLATTFQIISIYSTYYYFHNFKDQIGTTNYNWHWINKETNKHKNTTMLKPGVVLPPKNGLGCCARKPCRQKVVQLELGPQEQPKPVGDSIRINSCSQWWIFWVWDTLPPIIMVPSKMGVSPIGSFPFKYSHFPLPWLWEKEYVLLEKLRFGWEFLSSDGAWRLEDGAWRLGRWVNPKIMGFFWVIFRFQPSVSFFGGCIPSIDFAPWQWFCEFFFVP